MICSTCDHSDFQGITLTPNRRELSLLLSTFAIDEEDPNAALALSRKLPNTLFVIKGRYDTIRQGEKSTAIVQLIRLFNW
jgi:NAD(P)H-hydrate repair Nnr-like enzyme with NAD(P)H-hydrate dehydratase domain